MAHGPAMPQRPGGKVHGVQGTGDAAEGLDRHDTKDFLPRFPLASAFKLC